MTEERFQSTPPARGATLPATTHNQTALFQSTPPREGGDTIPVGTLPTSTTSFQSTPPARGATKVIPRPSPCSKFQSTPPARGATAGQSGLVAASVFQSTPPARGATAEYHSKELLVLFQSTPPARGATVGVGVSFYVQHISIHAPREGGDECLFRVRAATAYFNPRPPRGGRLSASGVPVSKYRYFNPRPPRGGRPPLPVLSPAA